MFFQLIHMATACYGFKMVYTKKSWCNIRTPVRMTILVPHSHLGWWLDDHFGSPFPPWMMTSLMATTLPAQLCQLRDQIALWACNLWLVSCLFFTSPSSIFENHPYCWLNHNVFCLKLPSLWVKLSFFLVDLTTVFVFVVVVVVFAAAAAAAAVVVVVGQNTFLMVDTPSDK